MPRLLHVSIPVDPLVEHPLVWTIIVTSAFTSDVNLSLLKNRGAANHTRAGEPVCTVPVMADPPSPSPGHSVNARN